MRLPRSLIVLIIITAFPGCAPKSLSPVPVSGGIRFALRAPDARSVAITGSFNRWDKQGEKLSGPDKEGVWSAVLPLPPGRYEYLFVINGTNWLPDPSVPSVDDGFGGRNSVLSVP